MKKIIVFALFISSFLFSCKQNYVLEKSSFDSELSNYAKAIGLNSAKTGAEISDSYSLHFTDIKKAKLFLEKFKKREFNSEEFQKLFELGLKSEKQKAHFRKAIKESKKYARIQNSTNGGPGPCQSISGQKTGKIGLMPWSDVNFDFSFTDGLINNVNTSLTGFTFPLSVSQTGYYQNINPLSGNNFTLGLLVSFNINVNIIGIEGGNQVYSTPYTVNIRTTCDGTVVVEENIP